MKIVADDQIPFLEELFPDAVLIRKPGEAICRADLIDAEVLLVRTVTRVDRSLLHGTPVRFVGTATAGYDHLDTDWLAERGIVWACAPGANATAVAEYVLCVIAALRTRHQLSGQRLRAGVIGVGRVGSRVAQVLAEIGFEVIVNDPPRVLREPGFHSRALAEWTDLDLICVHAALTRQGPHPSYHLLDDEFFQRQKPATVLLNAARGAVIDTTVLLRQTHLTLCLDVWEHEPHICLELLKRATIATPHIAAYSVDAKRRVSVMLYQQAQPLFGLPNPTLPLDLNRTDRLTATGWEKQALGIFNPLEYTEKMKEYLLADPKESAFRFLYLRKTYPWRPNFITSKGS